MTAPFREDDSLFILDHFPLSTPLYAYGFLEEACAGTAPGPLDTDVEREYCEGQFSTFLPVLLFFTLSSWPGSSRLNVALL